MEIQRRSSRQHIVESSLWKRKSSGFKLW